MHHRIVHTIVIDIEILENCLQQEMLILCIIEGHDLAQVINHLCCMIEPLQQIVFPIQPVPQRPWYVLFCGKVDIKYAFVLPLMETDLKLISLQLCALFYN